MRLARLVLLLMVIVIGFQNAARANGNPFVEPPVFSSSQGSLDILMIAKSKPVEEILFTPPLGEPLHPTGWVYEICYRKDAWGNFCPPTKATSSEFGGIRLALEKGDHLKIRLVNRLPPQDKNKVAHYWNQSLPTPTPDPAGVNLPLSPTNIHTHGLVVEARKASLFNPTWGDNIYVDLFNPKNGMPTKNIEHQHGAIVYNDSGVLDYDIYLPPNIPAGTDWIHPHVHGITSDSLSSGLAGIITIGGVDDYASTAGKPFPRNRVRYLVLKDLQVLAASADKVQFQKGTNSYALPVANGEVLDDQQASNFCSFTPAAGEPARNGSCPGQNTGSGGSDFTGGRWFFPVSGTVFPNIKIDRSGGEIWSLANVGADVTYLLQLTNDKTGKPIIMQLISVDGASIDIPKGTSTGDTITLAGAKVNVVPCPDTPPQNMTTSPVCVDQLLMMPGARAEVWVTYRDENGKVAAPPQDASATLQTVGITTGAPGVGDPWPQVNLAAVNFGPNDTPDGLVALEVRGDALKANRPQGIFVEPVPYARPARLPKGCIALPEGRRRRIFYGLVNVANSNIFGLGYEEVYANGDPVPGTFLPIQPFDPSNPFICLPLGPGQKPVRETWELINLATELHNYHIHQTRFRTIDPSASAGSILSPKLTAAGAGVIEDNVALSRAFASSPEFEKKLMNEQNGYCTVGDWRSGRCIVKPTYVDIPFAELGEFVYHCHILEHEDAGMMAKIQVVPAPFWAGLHEVRDHDGSEIAATPPK
jgi:L-ascorbate oxidase